MTFVSALLIAIIGAMALHCFARYCFSRLNSVVAFLLAGCISGIMLIFFLERTYGWFSLPVFAGAMVFSFFCEFYIFLFTMVISSVSAALLISAGSGSLQSRQTQMLSPRAMLDARLATLSRLGLIWIVGDFCEITPKGRRLVQIIGELRQIFAHSGPYHVTRPE
jgi:hypothetical protein